jgi:translocation and assembly module TamB
LNSVGIEDPTLYKTSVDGEIGVDGSLLSNARISGLINVGKTEVTIPSSGISSFGTIPPITHINAPRDVRRTLARAGLNDTGKSTGTGSNGPVYPLDLTISAPQQIFVRGRGLEAELGGRLRLTGTTNNIISSGRFELVRGKLDVLEKRFDLDEGSIQLQGDFDPFIRFVAITTTSSGTASVIVDGSASSPEVRFESSPEAPQDEVLAQIFFGRDVTQLSALQALQLANAVATLAGRGGEGVISKLRRGFDLDDLDITTDEEGNAGLRAGKYISDNIYTDVTVGSQNNAEVSLNIDLTPTITARGKLGSDGETSLGIFFEKDY